MMKKYPWAGLLMILVLAGVACNFPFISQRSAAQTQVPAFQQPTLTLPVLPEADTSPTETLAPTLAPTTDPAQPQVLSDNGVQITLPGTYVLGDVESDLETLVDGISGEGADEIRQLYEANKEDIVLLAYDFTGSDDYQSSMLVLKNEQFSGMSLGMISSVASILFGDAVDSMSQERLDLGGRDTLRFVTSVDASGSTSSQLIYLLKDSGNLWVLGFLTTQLQADVLISEYDEIVASFEVISAE